MATQARPAAHDPLTPDAGPRVGRSRDEAPPSTPPRDAVPWLVALATLLAHVALNARTTYGFHRDELLYLAMGRHLRLWRMDFPPAIALVADAVRHTLGERLWAVRFPSALAGALLVVTAAWVARRLGAGPGMRLLAAVAVASGPVYFAAANLYQPVVFDQLWWTLALAALLWTREAGEPRGWLLVGLALGLGLLTKFSIAFVGVGILAALVLGRHRRDLLGPWPWLGALVALLVGSPSVVGQVRLGFPVVGQMRELRETQLAHVGAAQFFGELPLLVGGGVLLALGGLAWLLRARDAAWARELAVAPLVAVLLLAAGHGKSYYAAPAFPVLVAAGAAALGGWRHSSGRRVATGAVVLACLTMAAVAAPIALPLLPPAATSAYAGRLGIARATESNVGERLPLPQDLADMLGWEELARATARVVATLAPAERARAVIVGANYGRAGALELYGPRYDLPPVVSPNGSFWFWGPGTRPGDPVLVVGEEPGGPAPYFASCVLAARTSNPWGVPEERAVPITLCRGARTTLQALWPGLAGRQ